MINFETPWMLMLLPLPWLWRWLIPKAKRTESSALHVPFFQRLAEVNTFAKAHAHVSNVKHVIAGLIWLLLVIAVSGPQWLDKAVELPRIGRNILLAVDLSGSMSLPDFTLGGHSAQRLDVVKKIAGQFIDGRKGDRIGLILFGSKPYARAPLTYDTDYVKNALNDASIGLAGEMTAMGDAIGLAVKRLSNEPASSRVIILLTDGANNAGALTPQQAADLAAEKHIRIYTIGIGADRLLVSTLLGDQLVNPSADLDEGSLQDIARTTGGEFFRAKNTAALQSIYQAINKLEPVSSDPAVLHPMIPLYPWPLCVALLLSFGLAIRERVFLSRSAPALREAA